MLPIPAQATETSDVDRPVRAFMAAPPAMESSQAQAPYSPALNWPDFASLAPQVTPPTGAMDEADRLPSSAVTTAPTVQKPVPTDILSFDFSGLMQPTVFPAPVEATATLETNKPAPVADWSKLIMHSSDPAGHIANFLPLPKMISSSEEVAADPHNAVAPAVDSAPAYTSAVWAPPSALRRAPEPIAPSAALPRAMDPSQAGPAQTLSETCIVEQGELILDGTSLGRWIMDRIAREMTRPPAGMTGFDTRMTPLYSGPAIGI